MSGSETKQCPFCAEVIKKEAAVCRYCGRDLPKPEYNSPIDFDNGIAELNKEKKQRFNDNRECPICHGICNSNFAHPKQACNNAQQGNVTP